MPVTTRLNVALLPTCTLWLTGCWVIVGGSAITVRVATRLVVLPQGLLTTQLNWLPEAESGKALVE